MTTAENSVQGSRGLIARVTTTVSDAVGNAYGVLKRKAPTTEQVRSGISDQTTRVSHAYDQAKGAVGLRDYRKMAQMFKEWLPTLAKADGPVKKAEANAALGWLTDLPEDETESFVRGLYSCCSSFNFDLEWLIDPKTNEIVDEQLKQIMGEIVLLYCLAGWKADQMQDGIKVFVNLQKWLAKPFAKQYEEFNKQLFTKLVVEGLATAPPLELFLAPEEEREAYSMQAIKDLIGEENQRFYEILKTQVAVTAAEPAAEADSA